MFKFFVFIIIITTIVNKLSAIIKEGKEYKEEAEEREKKTKQQRNSGMPNTTSKKSNSWDDITSLPGLFTPVAVSQPTLSQPKIITQTTQAPPPVPNQANVMPSVNMTTRDNNSHNQKLVDNNEIFQTVSQPQKTAVYKAKKQKRYIVNEEELRAKEQKKTEQQTNKIMHKTIAPTITTHGNKKCSIKLIGKKNLKLGLIMQEVLGQPRAFDL